MLTRLANLLSLVGTQGANALLPIVIFPYVLSVLGGDAFARIVTAEALALILVVIVLYSFEVEGVGQVVDAQRGQSTTSLSRVFSRIIYIRLGIFALASPVVLTISLLFGEGMPELVMAWMLVALSYAIQPTWLFLGLEKNHPVAIATILSRCGAVVLLWAVLEKETEPVFVPLVIGGSYFLGAVMICIWALVSTPVRFMVIRWEELYTQLKLGREIFLGNVSVMLYRDTNVLLLGLLGVSSAGIAAYSMAEKIIKAIQAVARPLNQFYLPTAFKLMQSEIRPNRRILSSLVAMLRNQMAALAVLLFLLGVSALCAYHYFPEIRRLENIPLIIELVLVMAPAVFFGVANFVLGLAGLNMLGKRRYFFGCLLVTAGLSILFCVLFSNILGVFVGALSFVLSEIVLLGMIIRCYWYSSEVEVG